jgi:DNA-directed RNA polymerase subunit E'/Rpb7
MSALLSLPVSVEFFDNIYITAAQLQEMSVFVEGDESNPQMSYWVWRYGEHELPMYNGGKIRFRVESIQFTPSQTIKKNVETSEGPIAPMFIVGSIREPGLGMLEWWEPQRESSTEHDITDNTKTQEQPTETNLKNVTTESVANFV